MDNVDYISLKRDWICYQMAPSLDAALSKITFIPSGHIWSIDEDQTQPYAHFNVHLKKGDVFNLSRKNISSKYSTCFGKPSTMRATFFHGSDGNLAVADDDEPDIVTCSVDLLNDKPGNKRTSYGTFRLSFEFDSKCHFTLVLHLDSKSTVDNDLEHSKFQFVLERKPSSRGYFFKICKKQQISFGAPEEQTACIELVGAYLQRTELSVITITDKRTYFQEIFIRNLSGVAQGKTIKYIRFGNYIFQIDLADFYIYSIVAVAVEDEADEENFQWPWNDNDGQHVHPSFNADDVVKYRDLFEGCSADTNNRFSFAFNTGDFTDPMLNSDSKRESQALLALLYSEPIRNFETLEYNRLMTEHIEQLCTILDGKFLYLVHPMTWQGTFRDKKTTITSNNKVKQNWEESKKLLSFFKSLFDLLRRMSEHNNNN